MFIKFSDKTKNIMVKKSSEEAVDGYLDEECLFLDSNDEKDRRVKALSEYEKNKPKDKN
jgi:hypothetical protein